MKTHLLFALTTLLLSATICFSQSKTDIKYRDFVGANGKIIKAVLVDKSDDKIALLMENGRRVTIGYDKLSEDDQKYVREWNREKAVFLKQCRGLTIRELLELRGYESFKFRLQNNSIIVKGQMNGHDAKFLIDTGAGSSTLHLESAQNMECQVGPMDQKIYGIAGEAPAAWTEVDEIKLGESIIKDQRLLSADLMENRPPGAVKQMDALFGADFLSQLRAVISYKESRIFLRPDLADGEETTELAPEFRLFKSTNGKTYKGNVTEVSGSAVKIKLLDGKITQLGISRLSEEDQEYVAKWSPDKAAFLRHCHGLKIADLLELRRYESFTYERRRNHIFVDGKLNEADATYMLDTGAQTTVLHIDFAKTAKCEVGPLDQIVHGIGGDAPAALTKVKLVKLGTADITNRTLLSVDLFKDDPREPSFEAILGADFMRELDGVITYREGRIFLRQN